MNKQELKQPPLLVVQSRKLLGLAVVLIGSGLMIQQQWPF